jgi:hypothetical protein
MVVHQPVAFPSQLDKHLNVIRIEVDARRSLPLHLFQQRDPAFALADSQLNRFNLVGHDPEKASRTGSIQFDLMRLGAIT